jgi:hypothetical protein
MYACETELPEPILPPPEPLLSQFAARPVFVVGEVDDERLSSTYWLAPPPVDEADQDMEQVRLIKYVSYRGTFIQQNITVAEFLALYEILFV